MRGRNPDPFTVTTTPAGHSLGTPTGLTRPIPGDDARERLAEIAGMLNTAYAAGYAAGRDAAVAAIVSFERKHLTVMDGSDGKDTDPC